MRRLRPGRFGLALGLGFICERPKPRQHPLFLSCSPHSCSFHNTSHQRREWNMCAFMRKFQKIPHHTPYDQCIIDEFPGHDFIQKLDLFSAGRFFIALRPNSVMNNLIHQSIFRLELPWYKFFFHKPVHGHRVSTHGLSEQLGIKVSDNPEWVRSV